MYTIRLGFQEKEGSRHCQGQGWRRWKEKEVKERFRFLRSEGTLPHSDPPSSFSSLKTLVFFGQDEIGIFPMF